MLEAAVEVSSSASDVAGYVRLPVMRERLPFRVDDKILGECRPAECGNMRASKKANCVSIDLL